MSNPSGGSFAERIEALEEAYEFMLAYAAQGLDDDSGPGVSAREFLAGSLAALDGLAEAAAADPRAAGAPGDSAWPDFIAMLRQDAANARTAFALVAAQKVVSSALVDNLNASIHVRTLLTDLFIVDEALKAGG